MAESLCLTRMRCLRHLSYRGIIETRQIDSSLQQRRRIRYRSSPVMGDFRNMALK